MANVYTFPTYVLPSGSVVVTITVPTVGSTTSVIEKYFTRIGNLAKNVDFTTGVVFADAMEFEIENDLDDLFLGTILTDTWMQIKVTLDGTTIFIGVINKDTISWETWFDNNSVAYSKVTFRADWMLKTLENYTSRDLYDTISSLSLYYTWGTRQFSTFDQLLRGALAKITSVYLNTTALSWDLANTVRFLSVDSRTTDQLYGGTTGQGGANDGYTLPCTFSDAGIIIKDTAWGFGNYFGMEEKLTAGELFFGIISTFGLMLSVSYSGDDINVTVSDRQLSATPVSIDQSDLISRNVNYSLSEIISGVNVSSVSQGLTYLEGNQEERCFHGRAIWDVGNITGLNRIVARRRNLDGKSLIDPINDFDLLENVVIGSDIILNGEFLTDTTDWTLTNCARVASPYHAYAGSIRYNCNDSAMELGQSGVLTRNPFPNTQQLVMTFWVKYSSASITSSQFAIVWYDAGGNVYQTDNITIASPSTDWRMIRVEYFLGNSTSSFKLLFRSATGAGNYVYFDNFHLTKTAINRNSSGTGFSSVGAVVGNRLMRIYNKKKWGGSDANSTGIKYEEVYDNIYDAQLGGTLDGRAVTSLELDLMNNQTEIGSIDLPG